jgi:hypothetical protein
MNPSLPRIRYSDLGYMMKMLSPSQKSAVIERELPPVIPGDINSMADRVVAAAKSFVSKASASHEARIRALEQQMMEHGPRLADAMRRLSVLEQDAGN